MEVRSLVSVAAKMLPLERRRPNQQGVQKVAQFRVDANTTPVDSCTSRQSELVVLNLLNRVGRGSATG